MSSESTSQPQVTELSAESGEQILSLLQVQGEEGSGHETIQLVTTSGDGEGIDGQETLLLQPAIEVNGERHVILQQAQDPNTGEVLVFLQGENGETVCLPPEALNANIVQMGDGSGQVYTLALPSDADGSSVVVVSDSGEGGATLVTDETLGNVLVTTSSAGTMELAGSIETIVTSGDTFNIDQLAGEAALLASSSTSGTQVVQSVVAPLMATTTTVTSETSSTEDGGKSETTNDNATTSVTTTTSNSNSTATSSTTSNSNSTTTSSINKLIVKETDSKGENEISMNETNSGESSSGGSQVMSTGGQLSASSAAAAAAAAKIVEEMNSVDDINSKLNEAVSKLGDEKEGEEVDPNNMNYGSAVIQVQDANSTTSLDSLMANAMLAAGESNYVIMTTGEDGELPKEINLADVINAGSASGQTIFLQTSEGLVACQAATTGEDGSLQIVADGSGNAIAVSSTSNTTNSSFSEAASGQTLAYTLSSTSSGIELTPVSNVVSSTPNASSSSSTTTTNRNNQVTSVSSSRSRFSRQTKPRMNLSTSTLTSSSSSLSSSIATTIGETLLLPSKHLVSSSSLNHTSNSSGGSGFMMNSNSLSTNSRRRTLPNRGTGGRSNISVSITPSSGASSFSTNSSSPIIPVQPDAIHSSSSDFSTLKSSSSADITTDSSLLTEGVSRPSQLAASRRTYSKKNNIVWLNPETTTVAKRFAAATSGILNNKESNSNSKDGGGGKEEKTMESINDSKMIDLPVETANDISMTTTTPSGMSNSPTSSISATTPSSSTSFSSSSSSKLTVKPPTTLTVSNVPTLRSTKRVSEPITKSSATTTLSSPSSSSVTPLSPSKSSSTSTSTSIFTSSTSTATASSTSGIVNKDYSRVISTNVDKVSSSPGVVPSMIKVGAVPQLGRVITAPGKVTSPVKPNSPIKVTSPTTVITSPSSSLKVTSPTKSQSIVELNSDFDLDLGAGTEDTGKEGSVGVGVGVGKGNDIVLSPSRSPSRRGVTSPIKSPLNRIKSRDGSESDSEPIVRKPIDFDALIAATNPLNKMQGKSKQQNDLSESLKKSTDNDGGGGVTEGTGGTASKTRSGRKRLSESESGSDQVMTFEDNLKTTSGHSESGTPLKKRVNFALGDSGDNDLIVGSVLTTKDGSESETPNTRSRKRKADIETISDTSDQVVPDKDFLKFSAIESSGSATTSSSLTVACTPPPKKRANLLIAQSNDDNDLFVTPMSPVKSPIATPLMGGGGAGGDAGVGRDPGSIVDTPVSEARSTRSSRKRKAVDSEAETASSADEGGPSVREESASSSATPAKKRVNFAATTIEVIGDDEDEDGDDDDSDSVDEKRKEKRVSMRKRATVHRPPSLSSIESPQPILKVHKRPVESSPVLLHFGSDSNDEGGESERSSGGGGEGKGEGDILQGMVESRGPSEFFDFTINGCCFHIRHQSGRLTPFSPNESEGNYACMNNCGYRTSRMNNIILHNKDQCTVIKMQWQSEIQHLINRQRLMNQDESDPVSPISSLKATTDSVSSKSTATCTFPSTDSNSVNTDTNAELMEVTESTESLEPGTSSESLKSPTLSQDQEDDKDKEDDELEKEEVEEKEEEEVKSPPPNPSSLSSPPPSTHDETPETSSENETYCKEDHVEDEKMKEPIEPIEPTEPTAIVEITEKESVSTTPEEKPTSVSEVTEVTEPSESIESAGPSESSEPSVPVAVSD